MKFRHSDDLLSYFQQNQQTHYDDANLLMFESCFPPIEAFLFLLH